MINEFADAARDLNIDIMEVVEAASTKPYGFMSFTPGPGVGGHCIPCDPHYLLWQLRARRVDSPVVDAAMKAIAARPGLVGARARQILGEVGVPLGMARVLVLGVSYKAGLGDVRESPALEIIELLAASGAEVSYSDPFVDAIMVPTAGVLSSNSAAHEQSWDLVILHTLHPNVDYLWLEGHRAVLDATYRSGLSGVFHV
jgi:nucleotide sugar dehydrogenase